MIKKYQIEKNSVFAKSMILSLLDKSAFGVSIEGLPDTLKYELFKTSNLKFSSKNGELDPNSLQTYPVEVYFDEELSLKALIIFSKTKNMYFCFRPENLFNLKLRWQTNYQSKNLKELETQTEDSFKKKGKSQYDGIGDFNLIKDINYFEYIYLNQINPRTQKHADISRLIFNNTNKFTVDFIKKVGLGEITIVNKEAIASNVLTMENMSRLISSRKDCLFINFNTGSIEYFIYTYRPNVTNHYLLFKSLGENKFELLAENISFNRLIAKETKNLFFKDASEFVSKSLSNTSYNNFLENYISFIEDEEVDEEFSSELEFIAELSKESGGTSLSLDPSLHELLSKYGYSLENNVIYFKDYEWTPLGCFGDNYVKFKQNRLSTDEAMSNQISLKDLNKIDRVLSDLLFKKPSSRLLALEKLIDSVVTEPFDESNKSQLSVIEEIENNIKMLWPSDKKYPENAFSDLKVKYSNWRLGKTETAKEDKIHVIKPIKPKAVVSTSDQIPITFHGSIRLNERIGEMSEEAKVQLVTEAYQKGKNSVMFLEKDPLLFKFLQYQQSKYPGKTLRLFKDFIFIYVLTPPHELVTCFPLNPNFEIYKSHQK